jgi:hypothetical protein
MKSLELKFFWDMKRFAKSKGGKLLSQDFLGKNHPYKWNCSEGHIFYSEYWDLKNKKHFCSNCNNY